MGDNRMSKVRSRLRRHHGGVVEELEREAAEHHARGAGLSEMVTRVAIEKLTALLEAKSDA